PKVHSSPYFSPKDSLTSLVLEDKKKNILEPMDCRHSTGDDQRLRTQYRR
ncbi:unnamed protein product, partial [Staurois parvus]